MSKRSHREVWRQLVDEAGEEEIERAASVSVEQAEKELAAAGFDVAAERAAAEAFLDQLARGPVAEDERDTASGTHARAPMGPVQAVEQQPAPLRRRPRPIVMWLAAAAVAVGGGAALYAALHESPSPAPPAPSPPTPSAPAPPAPAVPDLVAATDLRTQAIAACDAKQWRECLTDLDKARAIDPDGDAAPLVETTRQRAIDGILKDKPPKPPKPY
jgi:hypothetical protein